MDACLCIITFKSPGAVCTSPVCEYGIHSCWTRGDITIFGFSFGNFEPRCTFNCIFRLSDRNPTEYSSFAFTSVTLKWLLWDHLLLLNTVNTVTLTCYWILLGYRFVFVVSLTKNCRITFWRNRLLQSISLFYRRGMLFNVLILVETCKLCLVQWFDGWNDTQMSQIYCRVVRYKCQSRTWHFA